MARPRNGVDQFFRDKDSQGSSSVPRIGIRLPALTLGPKRLTAPALTIRDLPKIDIVLLSHAHFDHFDMRTLHRFHRSTTVITAERTSDLLRWKRFHDVSELRWKERKSVSTSAGKIDIVAFRVKHWGARKHNHARPTRASSPSARKDLCRRRSGLGRDGCEEALAG